MSPWLLVEEVFKIQARVGPYRVPKTVNGGLRWLVARTLRASLDCLAGLNPTKKIPNIYQLSSKIHFYQMDKICKFFLYENESTIAPFQYT